MALHKDNRHVPVLLDEVLMGLSTTSGQVIVDGTLGNAGHAEAIAKRIGKPGILIGIDADPLAIQESRLVLENAAPRVIIENTNFSNIRAVLQDHNIKQVDAILLDLGLRRGSLEDTGRGFSFQKLDEPLDMRFNPNDETLTPASVMVNSFGDDTLADIFYHYADERLSRRYARAILEARSNEPIETVGDLVQIIDDATPTRARRPGKTSATKVFQALRMAVNKELEVLETTLLEALEILKTGGRLAVISFHSIEDRLVKRTFKKLATENLVKLTPKKPIKPTRQEILKNPLSRSATLRIITKL